MMITPLQQSFTIFHSRNTQNILTVARFSFSPSQIASPSWGSNIASPWGIILCYGPGTSTVILFQCTRDPQLQGISS